MGFLARKRWAGRKQTQVTSCSLSQIRDIGDRIRGGDTSAEEVTKEYLDTLNRSNVTLGSFISVSGEEAVANAQAVDKQLRDGKTLGPLAGIPLGIKDNICVCSGYTTAGSNLLDKHTSPYDAQVVKALKQAGATLIGKTNMDEFGMGSTTESSAYCITKNPWDLSRVPGGSSGGSAAAVAAAQCVATLGSDTGGSIRQPASFCGVVGLKPTYGLVSRHGLVSYASSFDCIGPVASSVEDAAILLTAMCDGTDDSVDSTKQHVPVVDYTEGLIGIDSMASQPLKGKKFALVKETLGEGVDKGIVVCVLKAASEMEKLGATVDIVSCPTFGLGLPAYYILALSEASSNLARYDAIRYGATNTTRSSGFGDEVKRRILMGSYALSYGHSDAYYKRAQETQKIVESDLQGKLDVYDALITPAAPTPAYEVNGKVNDPLAMFAGDQMTVNVNLAGLPAIVVRGGFVTENDTKLPVGIQMIGKPFGEAELLANAHTFELATFDTVNEGWSFCDV
ncbi:Asp-tRNA(Asn)/Glu-tRNA(Gln) amidotransferase subunit GatA [bacterium]|nr:Asp-tRNA(Asn)/Glu-tRNA(Gln) amidotransferase subunit GatA [bacterium]